MRDTFDDAIGVTPPARIDVDAIVSRQRRVAVVRSAATVAAASVAAVALVSAAVFASSSGGGSAQTEPGKGSQLASAGQSPSAAVSPNRNPESPDQIRRRLAEALTSQLTAALPGASVTDRRTKATGVHVYPVDGSNGAYWTTSQLTTAAGSGTITMRSAPRPTRSPSRPVTTRPNPPTSCDQFWAGSQTTPANASDRQCTASTGPDGQVVLSAIERLSPEAIRYEVVVLWPDSYVDVAVENYFEGWEGEGDPSSQTFLPVPQLTLNQLVALAESPSLRV